MKNVQICIVWCTCMSIFCDTYVILIYFSNIFFYLPTTFFAPKVYSNVYFAFFYTLTIFEKIDKKLQDLPETSSSTRFFMLFAVFLFVKLPLVLWIIDPLVLKAISVSWSRILVFHSCTSSLHWCSWHIGWIHLLPEVHPFHCCGPMLGQYYSEPLILVEKWKDQWAYEVGRQETY